MQHNTTYRQKDGGWQYIISYKEAGCWKQKSKQGFETKAKAKAAAHGRAKEIEGQLELSDRLDESYDGITFGEFAGMLLSHEKLYKEANTIFAVQTAVNNFEALHDICMGDIRHSHIQACIDKLALAGLKARTIAGYASKIKYVFNQAVNPHNVISASPISKIKLPSKTLHEHNKKINALNGHEINTLLASLEDESADRFMITLFAITTGLRVGELLGLTWDDIDVASSSVSVNKQWKRRHDFTFGFGKLKKENSYRVVPVPQKTLSELNKYRKKSPIDISNRVFPFNTISFTSSLRKAYKNAGFDITAHTLRHTYATKLIANGVDFKTAASLLGHDVKMTMQTYSHVTDDMLKTAADKINNIF